MENTSVLIDQDDDEIEIDILQILRVLKKKLWLILLIGILAGGGAGAYSKYVIIPQYQSTAMVYVLSKETTLASLADLQIGSQLTKDYKIIITSRPVLTEVINKLGLNLSYEGLVDKITIDNPFYYSTGSEPADGKEYCGFCSNNCIGIYWRYYGDGST